ncbi:MAG: hypothetical protein F6K22_26130 [Okeania sp. SIO2F4]|uniref:hypothetical protein n=1 Tax=Okeania sp. SIO2F4 TaxID=2607790 RepID=UPI00142C6750|nr:hypothetical protein [Okeania sp. SIO2F4]NES05976.1 hypothetical protein [Okeania sp. SIO2F4]
MLRSICLVFLIFLSSGLALSEPVSSPNESDVLFSIDLWPGEGIPRFKSKMNLQPLLRPNLDSPPVTGLEVKKGTILNFTETLYQTIESGLVIIEQTQKLEVTNYGNIKYLSRDAYYSSGKQTNLTLKKGDQINVLQNRAEGQMFFEYQGNIYAGWCKPCYSASYKTAWWVKVTLLSKSGWVLINENTVEFLQREF